MSEGDVVGVSGGMSGVASARGEKISVRSEGEGGLD